MPLVQRYGGRKIGADPYPGVRKTAAETDLSSGVGLDQAKGQSAIRRAEGLGRIGSGLEQIGTVIAKDRAEAFQTAQQQASETKLWSLDRQLGEFDLLQVQHPDSAFQQAEGPASIALVDGLTGKFDELAGTLEQGLSDRERFAFARLRERRRASLREALVSGSNQKMTAYAQKERTASLLLSQQTAIAGAETPRVVTEELERQKALIDSWPGLGPDARSLAKATAISTTHEGVIASFLSRGQDARARAYYQAFQDQIVGEKRADLEEKIGTASTAGNGLRAAEVIWQQFKPTDDQAPINLDRMEDAARALFGTDPKSYDATIKYLRERKTGLDAARADRKEAVAGTLWDAVNRGVPLADIQRSEAYRQAPGALQLQVSEHVLKAAEQRADRSYTLSERAYETRRRQEVEKEQAGWAMRWHYDKPEILSQMTENQILALTPDLGAGNVHDLLEKQRKYATSATAVRDATIDDQLFLTEAEAAGLHPFKPAQTEEDKAMLGQLRNSVEAAIDAEQRKKAGALSRSEKQSVMQSVIDRTVMLKHTWSADVSKPAAAVRGKDHDAAYVPLDQIPDQSLSEWVNVVRGQFPREQRASRAEILARYRDRIQRAHAAHVLGLGVAEETRRLEGR